VRKQANHRTVPTKLFTVAEANEQVPRLSVLLERLQRSALRLDDERRALVGGGDGQDVSVHELLRRRPVARAVAEEIDGVVQAIEATGAQLKDPRLGLVDFPAILNDEMVLLCWQFGEPAVAHWHRPDDGFRGRRPLAGARGPVIQ